MPLLPQTPAGAGGRLKGPSAPPECFRSFFSLAAPSRGHSHDPSKRQLLPPTPSNRVLRAIRGYYWPPRAAQVLRGHPAKVCAFPFPKLQASNDTLCEARKGTVQRVAERIRPPSYLTRRLPPLRFAAVPPRSLPVG